MLANCGSAVDADDADVTGTTTAARREAATASRRTNARMPDTVPAGEVPVDRRGTVRDRRRPRSGDTYLAAIGALPRFVLICTVAQRHPPPDPSTPWPSPEIGGVPCSVGASSGRVQQSL